MYIAKVIEQIDNGSSSEGRRYWNSIRVGIFEIKKGWSLEEAQRAVIEDDEENPLYELYPHQAYAKGLVKDDDLVQVGEYVRNYHTMYNTFMPFVQNGKWYALYSKDYTATRVMSLPDCKDLGGQTNHAFGFCPVDFYVPYLHRDLLACGGRWDNEKKDIVGEHPSELLGKFGFMSGCVWGDDSSWKVRFLDLRKVDQGEVNVTDSLGYIEQGGKSLAESVRLDWGETSLQFRVITDVTFRTNSDFSNWGYVGYNAGTWHNPETGKARSKKWKLS